jgi:hypothetical protein
MTLTWIGGTTCNSDDFDVIKVNTPLAIVIVNSQFMAGACGIALGKQEAIIGYFLPGKSGVDKICSWCLAV